MISKCNLVWFLGLNIPRGLCVSGHVVQAGFWGHLAAVRLGYITEMHWPRGPGKTLNRDWAKCNQYVQILTLIYKKGMRGLRGRYLIHSTVTGQWHGNPGDPFVEILPWKSGNCNTNGIVFKWVKERHDGQLEQRWAYLFNLQSFSVFVRNKRQPLIVACTYKFIINKKGTDYNDIFTVANTYSHLVTGHFKAKM